MYIETVPNRNSPPAILLREGWREGTRTRKRKLANLSHWPKPKIEALRRLLRDKVLGRYKVGKHFEGKIGEGSFMWSRRQDVVKFAQKCQVRNGVCA